MSDSPPAQTGPPRVSCPGPHLAFEYLQGWKHRSLSGQPVPVLSPPFIKKKKINIFHDVQEHAAEICLGPRNDSTKSNLL